LQNSSEFEVSQLTLKLQECYRSKDSLLELNKALELEVLKQRESIRTQIDLHSLVGTQEESIKTQNLKIDSLQSHLNVQTERNVSLSNEVLSLKSALDHW